MVRFRAQRFGSIERDNSKTADSMVGAQFADAPIALLFLIFPAFSGAIERSISTPVQFCRTIGTDHPSLPGHFPDNPIVPGVVILDEVLTALNEWRGCSRVSEIPVVKFLAPLKPGQAFTISLSDVDETHTEIDFLCRANDRVIAQGRIHLVPR